MLKLSRYFQNLSSSYSAELEDLRTDSEGKNVLKARLAKKREQLGQLLSMLQFAPEMVAVAFHDAFFFKNALAMETLVSKEVDNLTSWETISKAILIEPWAQPLVDQVLADPHGENFLVTTAGLEYLLRSNQSRTEHIEHVVDENEETEDDENNYLDSDDRVIDEGEGTEFDLDKAGADWLAEQGFDRKE